MAFYDNDVAAIQAFIDVANDARQTLEAQTLSLTSLQVVTVPDPESGEQGVINLHWDAREMCWCITVA